MELRNVMSSQVEVIRPDMSLEEAAKKMKDIDAGSMPVCDGDRLVGMVPDRAAFAQLLTADNQGEQHGNLVLEIVPADQVGCLMPRPRRAMTTAHAPVPTSLFPSPAGTSLPPDRMCSTKTTRAGLKIHPVWSWNLTG